MEHSEREFNPRTRCEPDTVSTERDSGLTIRLKNDHKAITRDLERLARAKLEANDCSVEAILFIRLEKSLSDHFKTEEQLLFPLLSCSLGSGVCDKLNNEHADMLRIAKKLTVQTRPSEEDVANLKQLLYGHISTEENVLLWYLDVRQPTG